MNKTMMNRSRRTRRSLLHWLSLLTLLVLLLSSLALPVAAEKEKESVKDPFQGTDFADWQAVLDAAKGSKVSFYGWGGSDKTNAWIDEQLTPYAKEHYDIQVERVPMNIEDILNKLTAEKAADKKQGSIDLIWINGENFLTARENDFLYGPFTTMLPNFQKYVDAEDEEVTTDFATPVEGYEAPYSKAQFVLTTDLDVVADPPEDAQALLDYLKKHPGTFTYPALPDFTGSAFVRTIIHELCDYEALAKLPEEASQEEVAKLVQPAMDYLKELAPYLWEKGKTYPATLAEVDRMFMDGQLHFSMNYDQNHAVSQILSGDYPETATAFLFDKGMVGNSSYVAIARNTGNLAGALCLADAILSPEMQASKMDPQIWGTLPVLDMKELDKTEKKLFDETELGKGAIPTDELLEKRVTELPAYLIPQIEAIWTEEFVK